MSVFDWLGIPFIWKKLSAFFSSDNFAAPSVPPRHTGRKSYNSYSSYNNRHSSSSSSGCSGSAWDGSFYNYDDYLDNRDSFNGSWYDDCDGGDCCGGE